MKVSMQVENPDEVNVTLTVTLPLRKWRVVMADLLRDYGSGSSVELANAISGVIDDVATVFGPPLSDPKPSASAE